MSKKYALALLTFPVLMGLYFSIYNSWNPHVNNLWAIFPGAISYIFGVAVLFKKE